MTAPAPPLGTPARARADLAPALLPYQQERLRLSRLHPVVLDEKSRRIGASWAWASEGAQTASASRAAGGMDVLYIGYNLDMAREFIEDCAFWSHHLAAFAGEAAEVEEFVFEDNDVDGRRAIQAFRIRFVSGFKIEALSSRPRSLRGRQGLVIIDEAAFHDDLPGLIKAALALLMWGGRVVVISTHDGADNPFNELIEDARAGRRPYKIVRTTFDEAVEQGLYKRICLVNGWDWSADAERAWVREMREFYGDDADEELDCVPAQGTGVWLSRAVIDACMNPHFPVVHIAIPPEFVLKPDVERESFVAAWLEDEVDPLIERLDKDALSFAGGDVGRSGDLTCLLPGQKGRKGETLTVPFAIELRNMPFREQEQVLFHLLDGLPNFVAGALDARGIGAALAEFAMQRYGERIEEVKASQDWYRQNMPGLKARFEDRTIEIPRDDDIRADLRLVKLTKGVAMVPENKRIRSTRGGKRHGDAAIAAALLHFASEMEVVDYGYVPAPPARRRADEPSARDDGDDVAPRVGRMRGTW